MFGCGSLVKDTPQRRKSLSNSIRVPERSGPSVSDGSSTKGYPSPLVTEGVSGNQGHVLPPPVSLEIHSDASLWGWGGHSDQATFSGMWSPTLAKCYINFLELMAAFLCLKRLDPSQGSHVRLVIDNMTAVSCVRRGFPFPSSQRGTKTYYRVSKEERLFFLSIS